MPHLLDYGTYIPEVSPADEVRMVDLSLRVNMLPRPYDHGLGRGDINERRLPWVGVRDPYRKGEAVCGAAEVDRYRAGDVEEEGRAAVGECCIAERPKSV